MSQKEFRVAGGDDTIRAVVVTDTAGNGIVFSAAAPGFVAAAGTELAVGASVSAAANNQTLAGTGGKTTYISGFHVDGLGATSAVNITITITGLVGTTTLSYVVAIPAGATVALGAARLIVEFARPIPASAANTAIVVNVPSYGAGNTQAVAGAHGFQL